MRRDGSGNLIFEHYEFMDMERVGLIAEADPVALIPAREGDEEAADKRWLAQAMISAGLEPSLDGLKTDEPPTCMRERARGFLHAPLKAMVFVIRQDEIKEVCANLQAYNPPEGMYNEEERRKRIEFAKALASNIEGLEADSTIDFK